ncbi:hypothetical protein [Nonomuraea turcica]|uniref:hypothetical protein n=1 Tax=Nonomuraea sp. G32 TaxID=3067274 RepID=UPI00273B363E|nr:hypothetical protein [Nonomuraea sp. G32]MDP4510674.1 hypothetical protein [Nonomuraea sp. G32]
MGSYDLDDLRVSPQIIATAVPGESSGLLFWVRFTFCLRFSIPPLVFVPAPEPRIWIIPIAVLIGCIAWWLVDGRELLQRRAEAVGKRGNVPKGISKASNTWEEIHAGDVRAGDWVCTKREYDQHLKAADELNTPQVEEYELRWQGEATATYNSPRLAGEVGDASKLHLRKVSVAQNLEHSPISVESLFRPVFIALPPDERQAVTLWLWGKGAQRLYVGDSLCRQPRTLATPANSWAADTIVALMERVSESSWRLEAALVHELASSGHSAGAIRHALRSCLASDLIHRDDVEGRSLLESLPKLGSLLPENLKPIPMRRLKRTPLGSAWIRAREVKKHQSGGIYVETQNVFNIHDSTIQQSVIGSGNVYNYEPSKDLRDLARKVSSYLDEHRRKFPETGSEEAVAAALDILQHAVNEPDLPESKVKGAFRVLARYAEGIFVGVLGNGLFKEIEKVIGAISS